MNTRELNSAHLIRELDTFKLEICPLHAHALQQVDLNTREMYASVLAAVLLVEGKVSSSEQRLFNLLLNSLGLYDAQVRLYEQACALNRAQISEFLRLVKEVQGQNCFVLDALVLCRVDGQMTDIRSHFLSEIIDCLQVPDFELSALVFWVSKILRLPVEIDVSEQAQIAITLSNANASKEQLHKVKKIAINKGDYISSNQVIAVASTITNKVQIDIEYRSTLDGLVYSIPIEKNQELKVGQVLAQIVPISSATNAWLEFI